MRDTSHDERLANLITERRAFMAAIRSGNVEHCRDQLAKGFSLHFTVQKMSPLDEAVHASQVEICELVLAAGAEPRGARLGIMSPLHTAIGKADLPMVKLLIRYGAALNEADADGNTPLHRSASFGSNGAYGAEDDLIEGGADIEAKNKKGETALFQAVNYANDRLVRKLLLAGADPRATNNEGQRVIDLFALPQIKNILNAWLAKEAAMNSMAEIKESPRASDRPLP